MSILILTGASGAGKTAIAEAIESQRRDAVEVLHFDSVGVPSRHEMVAVHGSSEEPGGAWQRATTLLWMERLASRVARDRSVLFEGQMRPSFIRSALQATGMLDASVILVDCDDATRMHRLSTMRRQPDLADLSMMKWAAFLRREAEANGYEIFDTSRLSLEASVARVCAVLAPKP